ncbi:MAG: hypothetical protein KDK71_04710 [Chlamydiia bacterium]|nr:hypothetical protein [Chlamydiia bacterium]
MKKLSTLFFGTLFFSFLYADYSYDNNGNIASIYNPEIGEVSYKYDPIQRLIESHYPNGKSFFYVYDYSSNLKSIEGPKGTVCYSYDNLNRIAKALFQDGSSIAYRYDLTGKVTHLTYPDGEVVEYRYDERGRLEALQDNTGITSYEYDNQTNLVLKETFPNGTTTEYVYNLTPQIIKVCHNNPNGDLIHRFSYSYDAIGQIILCREETPLSDITKYYTYDKLNRLVHFEDNQGKFEDYTYDSVGNRLSKSTQDETIEYRYDHKNRLIQAGETLYQYDSIGNLVQKTSPRKKVQYSYDPTGRLVNYSDDQFRVTFDYDGQGRRISKTVNGQTTFFVNDPQTQMSRVLVEKDQRGFIEKKYIYGLSRVMQKERDITQYFIYDYPGKSVCCLLNHKSLQQDILSYNPFGMPVSHFHSTPYLYNGEEYDEETGLIFLRNRYYDPEIGRFITPDFVLGDVKDPQTLNPYVFACNNPILLIDPLGLYGLKVPLTFYGNYPGAKTPTGKSRVGHAWMGGVDEACLHFSIGCWPGGHIEENESVRSLCHESMHMTVWVTPEQSLTARHAAREGAWTVGNNCVDHVACALDAINYPHPSFKPSPIGVSSPRIYCDWIKQERHHILPNFLPQPGDILVDYFLPEPTSQKIEAPDKFNYSYFRPNYGGILLDKSAEFLTELSDISGVIYNEEMGELIFYGKKNIHMPKMDVDDLAVAVRSIFGLGGKEPQFPGVSMEPGTIGGKKNKKSVMLVSYFGDTENTRFGQVLFEADRVLKILSIGKDNLTGKTVKSNVPGYLSLQALRRKYGRPNSGSMVRLWFVPKRITLSESTDGTSMVFSEAQMEVLTESTMRKKGVVEDKAAEMFAKHFTQHYDSFSGEYPILCELKRLGKITAVVNWIREHNYPFDLTFFQSYWSPYYETPKQTRMTGEMLAGDIIVGGVVCALDQTNYSVVKNESVDHLKIEALSARPCDEELSWDFGRGLTAVAKPFQKTLKLGEVKKTFVDLSYPSCGTIPLAFVRSYGSFNEESKPFGRGWDINLAKISFRSRRMPMSFSDGTQLQLCPTLSLIVEGVETIYTLKGLNHDRCPVYRDAKNAHPLVLDEQGTFKWMRDREKLIFSPDGLLLRIEDLSGIGIDYHYENNKLVALSDNSGKEITLHYEQDRLVCITGPGGKTLYYDYYSNGLLKAVQDEMGVITSYAYDHGFRLEEIRNGRSNIIFAAQYDQYHRAIEQTSVGQFLSYAFNLSDKAASIKGQSGEYHEIYDTKHRPVVIQTEDGHETHFSYSNHEGPDKVTTSNGLEIEYTYDNQGQIIRIYDPYQGERHFQYTSTGKLMKTQNGVGVQTLYIYDDKDRLCQKYEPFQLQSLSCLAGKTFIKGNPDYLTTIEYDDATGKLASISSPGSQKQEYQYNDQGLLTKKSSHNGLTTSIEYDDHFRIASIATMGRQTTYNYDQRDRINRITTQGKNAYFSYDESNNLTSITDPQNRTTYFTYDESEKLIQTRDPASQSTQFEYTPQGLSLINLPNGTTREILYDTKGRLTAFR